MPTQTTNYNLKKPGVKEYYDVTIPNENMEIIDNALQALKVLIQNGALTKDRVIAAIDQTIAEGGTVNANKLNGKADSAFATAAQGTKADALVSGVTAAGNALKLGGELPTTYAKQATTYTKAEVDNEISKVVTAMDWKESVNTFSEIANVYPAPNDGWVVNVKDTDITYRYNGSTWVAISANAIPKATITVDGLMSKENIVKLNDAAPISSVYTKAEGDARYATAAQGAKADRAVLQDGSSQYLGIAPAVRGGATGLSASYLQFYNSGSTRQGWVGFGGNGTNILSIANETSGGTVRLNTNTLIDGTLNLASRTILRSNEDQSLAIQTAYGIVDVGAKNTGFLHIYTDRPIFYFNKDLSINGINVSKDGHTHTSANITDLWPTRISTAAPSGTGYEGQIWVQY